MSLFINDLFWTVQGEGANVGRRSLFVRMPHCNLACAWCDTTFDSHVKWSLDDFRAFAEREPARFAVVTGGEPLMHRQTPVVVRELKALGFEVACETNGTFAAPCAFDFITCSPKRDAAYAIHPDLYPLVSEFKYVVDEGFDFALLDRHRDDPAHQRHALSPEFGAMKESVSRILDFIAKNPGWRLSLQTHKWIGVA